MKTPAQTFKKNKLVIERVMKYSFSARNDYRVLVQSVYEDMGLHLTPEQWEKLLTLPTSETITRIARKFNEKGLYLPTNGERLRRRNLASSTKATIKGIDIKRPIRIDFDNEKGIATEVYA